MAQHYFNTTNEEGKDLETSEKNALRQEDYIKEFFTRNVGKSFSPDEIHKAIIELHNAPLTSVRRAITNLTNDGVLEKTQLQKIGLYKKKTFTWTLKPQPTNQTSLF